MTAESIAALMRSAFDSGASVTIEGGRTLRGMGRPPVRADVTLSTLELSAIVENAPADLTIAVQSGVTLRALAHTLSPHGTHVPFDAPRPSDATVGGTLCAGWLGPRRHVYGRPRDFVIGSVAVLADGTIARAGGMVVKNVSGYDMSRLYVGSFGTLAVLVQINLKTTALPAKSRVFHMRLPEGSRARAFAVLSSFGVVPSAAFWIDGFRGAIDGEDGQEGRIIVLVEGSVRALERATREVRSGLGRAGVPETQIVDAGAKESFERVVDAYVANVGERSITYRIFAHADNALECAEELAALATRFELRHDSIIDALNGDVIFRVSDLDAMALGTKIEMFDDALHDAQPYAMVIAGNHPHRPLLSVWGKEPEGIAHMRALKERFDPKNILNSGRFVAGL